MVWPNDAWIRVGRQRRSANAAPEKKRAPDGEDSPNLSPLFPRRGFLVDSCGSWRDVVIRLMVSWSGCFFFLHVQRNIWREVLCPSH